MKFEDLPLRVPNEKKIKGKIDELVSAFKGAKTKEDELKVIKKYFKFSDKLETDVTIISIRNSIDTTNKKYEKAMEKVNNTMPLIQAYTQEFEKLILESKHKDYLVEKLGQHYFDILENSFKCFNEKIIEECVEENKLTTEYQKDRKSVV